MNKKSEIALVHLYMYNTFPNINETNNQVRIYMSGENGESKSQVNIKIPSGCYEIKDIKKIILIKLRQTNMEKILNMIYGLMNIILCYIKCNYKVDFNVENS